MPVKQAAAPVKEVIAQAGPLTIVSDGPDLVIPPEAYRLSGFRDWVTHPDFPDHVRVFFDRGAVSLDVSKEELETHNKVKIAITHALVGIVENLDIGEFFGDGALITNVDADVSNNPDALFVRWESYDEGRVRLVARQDSPDQFTEIEGTPDWVLEIVSKSSVKKDTVHLREAYHRAGIPEYWLVDARRAEIDFQILQHRKSKYYAARRNDGWQWSAVYSRWFRLERTRNRQGRWRYSLLHSVD